MPGAQAYADLGNKTSSRKSSSTRTREIPWLAAKE